MEQVPNVHEVFIENMNQLEHNDSYTAFHSSIIQDIDSRNIVYPNGKIIKDESYDNLKYLNNEYERRINVLAEALEEKIKESALLQEENNSYLSEIKKIKKRNKTLKSDKKIKKIGLMNDKNDSQNITTSSDSDQLDEITALKLKLQKAKQKKIGYKEIVKHYDEEIEEMRFNMENRLDKEVNNKYRNEKENELITLRIRLEEALKQIHYKEIEIEILKLQFEKMHYKKSSYKELLENYEQEIIKKTINNDNLLKPPKTYGEEDIIALKSQMHKTHQKCLSYKESIKKYEDEINKLGVTMVINLRKEINSKKQYIDEVDDLCKTIKILKEKIKELEFLCMDSYSS